MTPIHHKNHSSPLDQWCRNQSHESRVGLRVVCLARAWGFQIIPSPPLSLLSAESSGFLAIVVTFDGVVERGDNGSYIKVRFFRCLQSSHVPKVHTQAGSYSGLLSAACSGLWRRRQRPTARLDETPDLC